MAANSTNSTWRKAGSEQADAMLPASAANRRGEKLKKLSNTYVKVVCGGQCELWYLMPISDRLFIVLFWKTFRVSAPTFLSAYEKNRQV